VTIVDLDSARAEALAEQATAVEGLTSARVEPSIQAAVESADVVVSAVSFGPAHQALDESWLTPGALFVTVDYDMEAPAALAEQAFFVVDERSQFLATRAAGGYFAGYPDPDATLGEALAGASAESANRQAGRTLVAHLGTGLVDVVFAAAIVRRAEQLGLGTILPR
jgi:ornithine cyclodeaminase/alanine dehydrogenase-like protein (mu-crystallin family)